MVDQDKRIQHASDSIMCLHPPSCSHLCKSAKSSLLKQLLSYALHSFFGLVIMVMMWTMTPGLAAQCWLHCGRLVYCCCGHASHLIWVKGKTSGTTAWCCCESRKKLCFGIAGHLHRHLHRLVQGFGQASSCLAIKTHRARNALP